ncbi:amino acid adenylation protein [Streptomyces lavendulae subsp. lavendulae]|uniref:non-ribosomal peptide synthetase n=1 Tax=Streptomyces lavendulae TaxID=1914 RepID=UPI0024A2531C|nr:amino acid adenylation domain-containing protein [Streptomyces lavendulae]GLV84813.1 amino acid adenylation protein [Streptomyces lavendulae subsp. lavendulae]
MTKSDEAVAATVRDLALRLGTAPESVECAALAKVLHAVSGGHAPSVADLPDGSWHEVLAWAGAADVGLPGRVRTELAQHRPDGGADYLRSALRLLEQDPDADHREQSLLSAAEREYQLTALAGPSRELPDRRVHELFEEQAAKNPDAVAARCGDRTWTYGELNKRANRLARLLINRGLEPEAVVAVVTERHLNWLMSVLAVFKAGYAYLPVEPGYPADRVAAMVARSGCALVLTERSAGDAVSGLTDTAVVLLDDVDLSPFEETDPGIAVAPDQLAYIFFTSGSTGEPKGAMCEHLGMLNHMLAKIEDLEIDATSVVAQTASQCFDISVWQLLAALLVGGRTVIVEQDVVLDIAHMVTTLVEEELTVWQVVPSYLNVMLSFVERRAVDLPALRFVSATGEALHHSLVTRWFAQYPQIRMLNAYGLTETSDDTNHEILDAPPEHGSVPLGRAVRNVRVYVVDERLRLVPLGAPGEIVFSGICVGRGYIGDPELTRRSFLEDPHRPGERLYRSGDFGRWMPDGRLEFHGRRDAQVKVRGRRVEIGEVESRLLKAPGVRDCAVLARTGRDGDVRLVAWYAGTPSVRVRSIRDALGDMLPEHMVPSQFYWLDTLPTTGSDKIDRKALNRLLDAYERPGREVGVPRTATERRLAGVWAEVLGVPVDQVDPGDHFFEQGGTSLAAIRLLARLDGATTVAEVTRNPVLADLAAAIERRAERTSPPESRLVELTVPVTPPVVGTLVCFPYAGGNAVNYRAIADALAPAGIRVYGVELSGGAPEFRTVAEAVREVVPRLAELGPLALWGHSAGTAYAIEAARQLHALSGDLRHVFLAAQLLGAADERAKVAEWAGGLDDAAASDALLAEFGAVGEAPIGAEAARRAAAAYRHDVATASRYLADVLGEPPAPPLPVAASVVVALDDPGTAGATTAHRDWERLVSPVALRELPDGGHHFLHTRPAEAAAIVIRHGGFR